MGILQRIEEQQKSGLKVLFFGATGTGKTRGGLTFPKIASIDSEDGQVFYMKDAEIGKNLVFRGVTNSISDVEEIIEEFENGEMEGVKTLLIDSETKLYESLQNTMLVVAENRARLAKRSVDGEGLSVKEWGKIGQVTKKLQNMKIMLASKGINIVSIAQEAEIKKKDGESFVITGHKPDVAKGFDYNYDIIVRFFTEDVYDRGVKSVVFKGEVLKDRTMTFNKGTILDNPNFEMWESAYNLGQNGKDMNVDLRSQDKKDVAVLDEQENINAIVAKIKKIVQTSPSAQKIVIELMKSGKVSKELEFNTSDEAQEILTLISQQ